MAAGTEAESSLPDDDGIINLVTVNSSDADVTGFTLKGTFAPEINQRTYETETTTDSK